MLLKCWNKKIKKNNVVKTDLQLCKTHTHIYSGEIERERDTDKLKGKGNCNQHTNKQTMYCGKKMYYTLFIALLEKKLTIFMTIWKRKHQQNTLFIQSSIKTETKTEIKEGHLIKNKIS